jgi:protein O-GlcNAc transferase
MASSASSTSGNRGAAMSAPPSANDPFAEGVALMDAGRTADAVAAFRRAVAVHPAHSRSWNNLGFALHLAGDVDEAIEAFRRALAIDSIYPLANLNLARALNRRDSKAALRHAEAAVKADPRLAEGWLLIGELQRRRLDAVQAASAINESIRRNPQDPAGWISRAELLMEVGRIEESREQFKAISARFPSRLRPALGANLLLPRVYESVEHLEASRRAYADGLERLHAAAPGFTFASPEAAIAEASWSNFFLAYQGHNDRELQASFAALQQRVLEPLMPELLQPRAKRASGGARIRVGFASQYFFNSVVGRYFASWITHLDKSRFDTFVYYTNELVTDDSRAIGAAAGRYRHATGWPLVKLARQVVADDLDILVYPEIGMHPETEALASLRLAPVQCAAWGHPTTTGSPEIDWFISCADMEPEGAASHYTERLALLPGLGTRYALHHVDESGTRADAGIPESAHAYLVPQSLFKIHPDNDDLIAEVLAQDPAGIAVMFTSSLEPLTRAFTRRLDAALGRRGLDIGQRVRFLTPNLQHAAYLRLNQLCDVMLDTLHWSGGNTSLDALAMGLPVVTLPGGLMRGRQSQAMLRAVGMEELVARDRAEYVAKAVAIGRDRDRRRHLSERIAAGRGALFEREEPLRALEDFLEKAARG